MWDKLSTFLWAFRENFNQGYPPKPRWTVDDIPDLSGKVMIVTGANTGLGKETVKQLLLHNAKVYLAARNASKAQQAIEDLKSETGGKEAVFLELDLASLGSVKRAAEEFLSKETRLDVLFNNGGIMRPPIDQLTSDGYDLQIGTNVLGPFYLTTLLLPTLISTAKLSPSSSTGHARIITTSSVMHMFIGDLKFNTFRDSSERKQMRTDELYSQSKFANVVFAKELARRYADQGIVSISLNPGNIKTDLVRHAESWLKPIFNWLIFHPISHGVLTQLYAGTSEEAADMNGKFLIPWSRPGTARKEALNPELGEKLWSWCESEIERFESELVESQSPLPSQN